MTTTKTILSVWIGNLGDYNAGILRGDWYNLDDYDLDELTEAVDELTNDGQNDYFIADSMSDYGVEVGEYESLESLYEKYDLVNDIIDKYGDNAGDVISAYTDLIDSDLENISSCDFYFYSDCYTMADVAYEIMDQTGELDEMPEHLRRYFDYESYGRDIEIEGYFYYAGGGLYVEIVR